MTTQVPQRTTSLSVAAVEHIADDTVAITLVDPCGDELPAWRPGAHIDLVLGPSLVRQYSLCGDPADRHAWRLAVLREQDGRGGSAFIHDQVRSGSQLTVQGPRNHFQLIGRPRYAFIAGGIGITPILPMIAAADVAGADWQLLYGGRRRSTMAFLDELSAYGDRVTVFPQDELGLLDVAGALGGLSSDTAVYCCGPEPLLAAVEATYKATPAGGLHVERFAPKEAIDHSTGLEVFEVVCERSGITLTVPRGVSILQAAGDAGIDTVSSCGEGTCGTCETEVIEGRPDHRDSFLTEDEREDGETMCICVSRSLDERLVLDL